MILSDEPGFYLPGAYGIRIENLLLTVPAELAHAGKPFLRFETLTLAPYDRRLISLALLGPDERRWIDAYHPRVHEAVAASLPLEARVWLEAACEPLS